MAESTTIERNKELVRRLYEEAWNERDISVAEEIHADEWVHHNPSNPEDIEGVEGWKHHMRMATEAFPDVEFILHDLVAEEDAVVAYWTFSGTHEHEFAGIPATGEQIAVEGFNLHHVHDGKLVEEWAVRDSPGMLEQFEGLPRKEREFRERFETDTPEDDDALDHADYGDLESVWMHLWEWRTLRRWIRELDQARQRRDNENHAPT